MRSTFSKSQVIIARLLLVLLLLESCSHANISLQPQPAREVKESSVAHNSLKQVATSTTSGEPQVSKTSVPSNSEITYANDKQNLEQIGSNRDLKVQQKDRLTSSLQSNGQQTHIATGHHIVKDNKLRRSIAREQHLASNHKVVVDKKAARVGAKTKESLIELLINQICIIKGGHEVNFKQQETGELVAIVKENCPQGFSKTHTLPVYIVPGLNYSEKAVKAPVWQQQFIYFTPNKGICIGQPGLLGGGKDKKGKGKEEGDPEAEPTEWKEETKRGGTTSPVRYGKKELKRGEREHSVLSAFFNSLIEKDKKLPVDLDKVKLSKESLKSLWHVGQGIGEEHYRNRALELLALDAINKGKDNTAGYLKKLAKLGTIPTIVEHNQAALPADWCSKSTDELEEILYKLYSQALEAMEQRLAQLPIDMQAAYQLNILQLQYYFQRLLETSHPLKTSIIQKIQTDLDSLSLLPMGEEIKLRRTYLAYLTQARDNINLEKDLARIKKYIEKVAELGKKGKSKAKNTRGVERDILRRFSGRLFREAGDLSKRLAENPQQVGKSLDWQRSYYLQASKLGDKIAYYKLGMLYADSEHTDYYDIDEAKEALEESAGEGYVLACYALAVHYEKAQNNKLALAWHKRAAEEQHPASLYKLYQSYKEGKEVEEVEGIKYLEQAGILGHKEAQHELGTYYWEQGDYKRAVDWHKKAAFQGIQASYSCLGHAATEGLGHPKDKQAALKYYLKSGVKMEDSSDLQYAKGRSYEKGAGVEKNLETALTLYSQASALGHQKAAYHAGLLHLQSKALADEMKKTYELIHQAAQQGSPKACLLLGRMHEYGLGVALDPLVSIKWYKQASVEENQDRYTRANALYHLGWLYKRGVGISKDENQALAFFEQAALVGDNSSVQHTVKHAEMEAATQTSNKDIRKEALGVKESNHLEKAVKELKEKVKHYEEAAQKAKEKEETIIRGLPEGENILKQLKEDSSDELKLTGFTDVDLGLLLTQSIFRTNKKLNKIIFERNGIDNIEYKGVIQLAKHLQGTYIQEIQLTGIVIGDQAIEEFAKNLQGTKVHTLKLRSSYIKPKGAEGLAKHLQNTQVHTVDLSGNQIGAEGAEEFVKHLQNTRVHTVDLSWNQIEDKGARKFTKRLRNTNVHTVYLNGNNIGIEGATALADYLKETNVHTISLKGSEYASLERKTLGNKGAVEFIKRLQGTRVHTVNLAHNKIEDEGVLELAKHLATTQIHTINLGGNQITVKGAIDLYKQLQLTNRVVTVEGVAPHESLIIEELEKQQGSNLDLSSKELNSFDNLFLINHPLFMKNCKTYTEIDLSGNKIGNEGIRELAKQLKDTNVHTVYLKGKSGGLFLVYWGSTPDIVDAKGVVEFVKNLQGTNVHTVDLSNHQIGDERAIELATHLAATQIHTINLGGNQITDKGAIELYKQLHLTNRVITVEGLAPHESLIIEELEKQQGSKLDLRSKKLNNFDVLFLINHPLFKNCTTCTEIDLSDSDLLDDTQQFVKQNYPSISWKFKDKGFYFGRSLFAVPTALPSTGNSVFSFAMNGATSGEEKNN
ncbi:MAG: hypothetical protein ACYC2U_04595 [Candidatus Amoebophilus sp.]